MSVTVSITQINPIVGSFKQNLQMVADAIVNVKSDHADAIVFPELALTGYPPEDLLFRPIFIQKVEDTLQQIAKLSVGIATIIGAPVIRGDKLYNMACIRITKRAFDKDRRYPITSHYRWNLT
ncbi:MAG: nitrilase-related carbon-nitrogen hydrolase [Cocleimonas sp.]